MTPKTPQRRVTEGVRSRIRSVLPEPNHNYFAVSSASLQPPRTWRKFAQQLIRWAACIFVLAIVVINRGCW